MTTMYARLIEKPESSILLFGPRGTGKSTWIREQFPGAIYYDLLNSRETLRLERNPSLLYDESQHLEPGSWIVIDEVQKVPALMDEVQRLVENKRLKFILCGSSARKMKRSGTNLLAGRAIVTSMFPLTSAEIGGEFNMSAAIKQGTLPMAVTGGDPVGYLETYANTYLNEEIRAEALTRNVGAFSRFLEIAARQNGQVTNISNIARDAAVSRSTVSNYFEILVDTLIGYWVLPWKLKQSTKQIHHPKFYLFDTGVARALSGRLPYPPSPEESGPLFETLMFNEFKAYSAYSKKRYQLYFWRNYDGTEVDLLCETRDGFVAIEFKSTELWQNRYSRGLKRIQVELDPNRVSCYGVYLGKRRVEINGTTILPAKEMLDLLWGGRLLA
jgi:uncharacterized protein